MPTLTPEYLGKKHAKLETLKLIRQPFFQFWRELADFYLPRRYMWLAASANEYTNWRKVSKNSYILDNTGMSAARILASGMMNGITSPSRPWFKLRIQGIDVEDKEASVWLEDCTARMQQVLAESNFYNAMALVYLDLVIFGTAACLIYEDYNSVIHCYNPALGEYFLGQDSRLQVNTFAREINYTVEQCVERFGIENVCERTRDLYNKADGSRLQTIMVSHLIEPNTEALKGVPARFAYREFYWESGQTRDGKVLSLSGYNEVPGIFPRWEATGNDAYGNSPAMDALPDVIQLQHQTKKKAQSLDKMISPPIVADIQLQHKPTSLLPGGVTYVAGVNNVGAKPIYTVNPPLGEMSADTRDVQIRIRETFHNNLFNMISQLETVRSAAEIDARREEKLILLGPVLERFHNEALDPGINRVFNIMMRGGLFLPPPEHLQGQKIEIQYVSILSSAQSAVAVASTERFLGLVGNLAAVAPQSLDIPNFDELLIDYGRAIGVPAKGINSREEIAAARESRNAPQATEQALAAGDSIAGAAKNLSETDVGGGRSVLQELLG